MLVVSRLEKSYLTNFLPIYNTSIPFCEEVHFSSGHLYQKSNSLLLPIDLAAVDFFLSTKQLTNITKKPLQYWYMD